MAHKDINILVTADRLILELFEELEKLLENETTIRISGLQGPFNRTSPNLSEILKISEFIIDEASLNRSDRTFSVVYSARQISNGNQFNSNPNFSVLRLNINDQSRPSDDFIIDVLTRITQFTKKNFLLPGPTSRQNDDDIGPQIASLSAIQATAADQIARTNEFFARLREEFDARRQELDSAHEQRLASLAAEKEANEAALKEERAALEARKKELDDRDNTHARRAIRGELIATIQQRQQSFTMSPQTGRLRWPIHVVFVLLLAGSGLGALWSLWVWGANPVDSWGAVTVTSALKTAVFTFGFLTSAGLYISWMNRWFDKHADAQFQTKQFEIDINRATWAVEAALEWKKSQGEEIPEALLLGVTKHLFDRTAGESAEYSPLEALASSILGSAANMKLNLNGNELTLDRKSVRQLRAADK